MCVSSDLLLTKNLGVIDRIVRAVLGVALAVIPSLSGWNSWAVAALAAFGGAQLIESVAGY